MLLHYHFERRLRNHIDVTVVLAMQNSQGSVSVELSLKSAPGRSELQLGKLHRGTLISLVHAMF